jgi:PAS domain S-box-containing protein
MKMRDQDKTKKQLIGELEEMHQRIVELEESEIKHKVTKKKFREAEGKLLSIMDNVHDVIFQLSPLGTIKYVNPKVKELYGYEPEGLIGKHLKTTTPISEVPRALDALKIVMSGKTVKREDSCSARHYERHHRTQEGRGGIEEIQEES